jgi:hypothetical protein
MPQLLNVTNEFLIKYKDQIRKINESGIHKIIVDTERSIVAEEERKPEPRPEETSKPSQETSYLMNSEMRFIMHNYRPRKKQKPCRPIPLR